MPKQAELRSYEPTWRDRLADMIRSGVGQLGGSEGYADKVSRDVTGVADFLPGIGSGLAIDDTARAMEEGRYGDAAINSLGTFPGGKLAGAAAGKGLAMILGPMAKRADLAALARAKEMAEGGANRYSILDETGWQKDAGGDWGFEISDKPAKIVGSPNGEPTTMGEYYHHPELYENYPELADIPVTPTLDPEKIGGVFWPPSATDPLGRIGVTGKELTGPTGHKGILTHELQHPIQRMEGWGGGGSPQDKTLMPAMREIKEKAGGMYEDIRQEMFAKSGITPGMSPDEAQSRYQEWRTMNPDRASMLDQAWTTSTGAAGPSMGYYHLAGEVQARNSGQNRLNMDMQARRDFPSWETQDVPDELQIVRKRQPGGAVSKLDEGPQEMAGRDELARLKGTFKSPYSKNVKTALPMEDWKSTFESPIPERPRVRPEDLQGTRLIPVMGDRTVSGNRLTSIGDDVLENPTLMQGGPMHLRDQGAWASMKPLASGFTNRVNREIAKGDPVTLGYTTMGERSGDFSRHTGDTIFDQMKRAPVEPADVQDFDDYIRKELDPKFAGIRDESWLTDLTGTQRSELAQIMNMSEWRKRGFPDIAQIRHAITEPELRNVGSGQSGFALSRLGEGANMHPESGHLSYNTKIELPGSEYLGGFEHPLPYDVAYPEWWEKVGQFQKGSGLDRTFLMQGPSQMIDQQWVDRASKYLEDRNARLTGNLPGGRDALADLLAKGR